MLLTTGIIDNKFVNLDVFLDLKKVSDTVDYSILLKKNSNCIIGFSGISQFGSNLISQTDTKSAV